MMPKEPGAINGGMMSAVNAGPRDHDQVDAIETP
jgi:hypothetical protein